MMDPDQQEALDAHNKCMADIQCGNSSCGRGYECHKNFPKERMKACIQIMSHLGKAGHLMQLVTSAEHFEFIEALITKLELKWSDPRVLHLILRLTNEDEVEDSTDGTDGTDDTKSAKFWDALHEKGINKMFDAFVTCGEDPRPWVFYNPEDGCSTTFCWLCADPYFHAAAKSDGLTLAATREFAEALLNLNSSDNPYKCDECETWDAKGTVSCANCFKDFMAVATDLNTVKIHELIEAKEQAMRERAEKALRKKSKKKGLRIKKEAVATVTAAQAQLSIAMLKTTGELNDGVKFHWCTKCTHAKAEAEAAAAAEVKAEAAAAATRSTRTSPFGDCTALRFCIAAAAAADAENQPETCKQLTAPQQVVNNSCGVKRTRKPVDRYTPNALLDSKDPQSGPQPTGEVDLFLCVYGDEEIPDPAQRLRFMDDTARPRYLAFFRLVVKVHKRDGITGHAKSANPKEVYSTSSQMINFCHGGWQHGLNKRPDCLERPVMLGMYCRKCLLELLGLKPLYLLELLKCWGDYKLHVFWILRIQAELEIRPADWNGVPFTGKDLFLSI